MKPTSLIPKKSPYLIAVAMLAGGSLTSLYAEETTGESSTPVKEPIETPNDNKELKPDCYGNMVLAGSDSPSSQEVSTTSTNPGSNGLPEEEPCLEVDEKKGGATLDLKKISGISDFSKCEVMIRFNGDGGSESLTINGTTLNHIFTNEDRAKGGFTLIFKCPECVYKEVEMKFCPDGSCKACSSDEGCVADTANDTQSVDLTFNAGSILQGDSSLSLRYYADSVTNIGKENVKIASGIKNATLVEDANGKLISVATESRIVTFTDAPTAADPKAFIVNVSYDLTNPAGSVIRSTKIENITDATGKQQLKVSETFEGHTWVTLYSEYTNAEGKKVWDTLEANGTKRTVVTYLKYDAEALNVRRQNYLKNAADQWEVVSDTVTNRKQFSWGRELVETIVDPDGANLKTTYEYYGIGEDTSHGLGSEAGLGRLKKVTHYDGSETNYQYTANKDITYSAFQGNNFAKKKTVLKDDINKTYTTTEEVNGKLISKSAVIYNDYQTIRRIYTSATEYLESKTDYYPAGQADFAHQIKKQTRSDGTVSLYSYSRENNQKTTTVKSGAPNAAGTDIVAGFVTVSVTNADGNTVSTNTTNIESGEVTAHIVYYNFDNYGRALSTGYFPTTTVNDEGQSEVSYAYTTHCTYNCCGKESSTDKTGVKTIYAYDDQLRVIKTNRLGVTYETAYDGLTSRSYRYAESAITAADHGVLLGDASNEVARSVRNVAGTYSESWSRTAKDGTLVKNSSSNTSYNVGNGLSSRTVTQYIAVAGEATAPTSTTETYLDGRTYQSFGDMQPHTRHTCVAGNLGLECSSEILITVYNTTAVELGREKTVSYKDLAGRTIKTVAAPGTADEAVTSQSFYNGLGQLIMSKDGDGVTNLFAYNAEGERTTSALDLNGNNQIDFDTDQIVVSDYTFLQRDGKTVRRSFSKVWRPEDTTATAGVVVSHSDSSTDGLKSWSTQFPAGAALVSSSETTLLGNGNVTSKSTAADGTYAISTITAGLSDKTERFASDGTKLHTSSVRNAAGARGYDSLNRVVATKDSRTGVSTRTYQSLVSDVTTSSTDAAGFTTSVAYDKRGRTVSIDAPDTLDKEGNVIANIKTTEYFSFGGVKEQSGDQTYKTSYTYDYALRRKTLTTYGTTTAVTTWNYSGTRGWLESKTYADGKGTSYGYTDAGRLASRKWARTVSGGQKLTTTYGYDSAGRQTGITHNDGAEAISTAPFSTSYDRLSRPTLITRGSANGGSESTWGYTYFADSLLLDKETITYGSNLATPELKRTLGRAYDTLLRPQSQSLKTPTQGTEHSASYVYDNAGRLQKITDLQGNDYTYEYLTDAPSMIEKCISPVCVTTNTYEPNRNILKQKENKLVAATGDQTVSTFTYTVNGIGQRTGLITTGSAYGLNPVTLNWGYNNKGEVVKADHNNNAFDKSYDFDGIGNRKSTSDSLTLPAANNYVSNALNQYSNVKGVARTYDEDGNSTTGVVGTKGQLGEIKWNGNNRLTEVTTEDGKLVKVDYDHMGRRFRKSVTTGGETKYSYFVYSGYNAIAKYTGNSQSALSLQKSYYWGPDLGGGEGTGGLLSEVDGTDSLFALFDGNGNVTDYLKSDGTMAAHFEYSAFGQELVATGDKAATVDHGFSTRIRDRVLGMLVYNFRYLNVVDGQWINRDPIAERGGMNVYGFVGNDGVNLWDRFGLFISDRNWSGLRGDYVGTVCAEKGDTSAKLMGLILGPNANGRQTLPGEDAPITYLGGEKIDVSDILAELETIMREKVVGATPSFNSVWPGGNKQMPGVGHSGDDGEYVDGFFTPNTSFVADCFVGALVVHSKGVKDSLFAGEFDMLGGIGAFGNNFDNGGAANWGPYELDQGIKDPTNALLGDWTYMKGYEKDHGEWGAEHIVKIGKKWWGNAGGGKTNSIQEWHDFLTKGGKPIGKFIGKDTWKAGKVKFYFPDVAKIADKVWTPRGGK